VETGTHGERTFLDQDMIVMSPGVPLAMSQIALARKKGLLVLGELELAYRFLKGSIIAITGSNGKTTTTSLVGEIMKHAGSFVQVGGNIGTPVVDLVENSQDDGWTVLEVSSFQLETIDEFRPKIAAILNITPDHLDRHGSMEAYITAKSRIIENQKPGDYLVINADDIECRKLLGNRTGTDSATVLFSIQEHKGSGAYVTGDHIIWHNNDDIQIMRVDEIPLKGKHNIQNVLAAVACTSLAGCKPEKIREAVMAFKAVDHRLQHIATIHGVEYYNDSKATNVDATIKALESFMGGIHLILGGKDKGSDYSILLSLLRERAKHVYTIGTAAEKIESQLNQTVPLTHSETLDNAVKIAAKNAVSGDVVLLAPACASFDQFQSYEHRGKVFRGLVEQLQSMEKDVR
jgi:UDP-N-acetylmuramoylalanine--D-glutamate ligase